MWTSLPTALVALLLLLDSTYARRPQRRAATIAAYEPIATAFVGTLDESPAGDSVVVKTLTVIPMPVGTVDGVFYSGVPTGTGIPSGIFYLGHSTGTGAAHPTGYPGGNGTGNHTRPHPPKFNSTSVSIPFFTLSTSSLEVSTVPLTLVVSSESSTSSTPQPTTSTSSSVTAVPTNATVNTTSFLRGVNLGGWLVLEKWMNAEAFTGAFSAATDQYTFDSIPGAAEALEKHWSTFFTEADIQEIAATGINALRIPIGYWAYDNFDSPYIKGADAYLEKAIEWARNAGMKVWVDCHGSPGSQNGFDNSGRSGSVEWQQGDNMNKSVSVLKIMAKKYGAEEYADVVVGLEMVNEPISWGNNSFETTKTWTRSAYKAVKEQVENDNLVIVMHDGFMGGLQWTAVAKDLLGSGARTFGVDEHLYQLFTDAYNALDQSQHITAACGWASNLAAANAVMPTYVGEWSAATNICVNPDGSTTAGTKCSVSGCQCQIEDFSTWNDGMIEQVRRYVEAQLDVFESSTSGYFAWTAKGPGGWGFMNGIRNGAIPNPVTKRKYPGQCGGRARRRSVRGGLGALGEAF